MWVKMEQAGEYLCRDFRVSSMTGWEQTTCRAWEARAAGWQASAWLSRFRRRCCFCRPGWSPGPAPRRPSAGPPPAAPSSLWRPGEGCWCVSGSPQVG